VKYCRSYPLCCQLHDATINVGFGGEVHDRIDLLSVKELSDRLIMADATLKKPVRTISHNIKQVLQVTRKGQFIQIANSRNRQSDQTQCEQNWSQ
jgi:translation initiation factor 2 alpha subunit (eIF-2alpha)